MQQDLYFNKITLYGFLSNKINDIFYEVQAQKNTPS
jgi:hypothetical protein